ncbi:MAG: tRNA (adenosine(37)-N6)-threonylcarbamoyltransferase complex ATPase subunit type 1 TsaE [Bacteroidetes bacterium]|nr:tRNA (adenosine(37)-N6)-threonylcarbamoyltransferase complex ATPase subunit type 1 TsaE [Bacteroidota bacterium]
MEEYTISSLEELRNTAEEILRNHAKVRVFLLEGNLGAGKTAFAKEAAKVLGIKDEVSSPTFSIINEYNGDENTVFHFDLYRLKTTDDLYQIGFEEYLDKPGYKFIEWPEIAKPILFGEVIEIRFEILVDGDRKIKTQKKLY